MYPIRKILLLTLLVSFFAHGEALFIKKDGLNLAHITLSETYCKSMIPSHDVPTLIQTGELKDSQLK